MPQLVATINGKKVYSDKYVKSIVGSRVTFTDGSWCDVATGQVVNKGPGYVNIGSPDEEISKKITVGPTDFGARNIQVQGVAADVEVLTHDFDIVVVKIVGPETGVKNIHVSHHGDTVVVEGEGDGSGNPNRNIVFGGRGTRINVGRTVISGSAISFGRGAAIVSNFDSGGGIVIGGEENETKITITIPRGGSVDISGVSGTSIIGDTGGPINVSVQGSNVSAGRVGSATISVQGSGDVNVKEVSQILTVSVQGSGDAKIQNGRVHTLNVTVMGSGDVTFGGEAESATLQVMGSGDIKVRRVKSRPTMKVMGSGDISVGNW